MWTRRVLRSVSLLLVSDKVDWVDELTKSGNYNDAFLAQFPGAAVNAPPPQ